MTAPRTYFLTTPIYYVNDVPHVGHAYTTIAADALTRSRRLQGKDAFLLTGTDEHGQNIERIARERGVPEQQHCDEIAARFTDTHKLLSNHLRFFAGLFVFLLLDHKNRVAERCVGNCGSRNDKRLVFFGQRDFRFREHSGP